jgi:pimeloyl-ACP methyl ester carboxylesterase
MAQPSAMGYAPVNQMELYWESYGSGGTPLIVVHGGFGLISMFGDLIGRLSQARQVVGVELQGHGHTRDIDRPFSYEAFGDDLAALVGHLELAPVDVLGYSLGAGASARLAIQHPGLVRRLVLVSIPFRRDGWYPEVRTQMDQLGAPLFAQLKHSPMYAAWSEVAPDREAFPTLIDKTGELQRTAYDWSDEVPRIEAQTLLAYADADSVPVTHVAEFYALLGGGTHDAGWDGSERPQAQLAILPGLTHYDIFRSPKLMAVAEEFLS